MDLPIGASDEPKDELADEPRLALLLPIDVRLEAHRTSTAAASLTVLLVERELADLPDAVPMLVGVPAPPGSLSDGRMAAGGWSGTLVVGGAGGSVQAALRLCSPVADCVDEVGGPSPWEAATQLGDTVRAFMGAPPGLPDPPAGSLAIEPLQSVAAELLGERRARRWRGLAREPLDAVLREDPSSALAWWLLGRRASKHGRERFAATALAMAWSMDQRPATLADALASRLALDDFEGALALLRAADEELSGDPRLAFRRQRAMCAEAEDRAGCLDVLLKIAPHHKLYAERLALAPTSDEVAAVLKGWAAASPADPEPVRRHLDLALSERRFEVAGEMVEELHRRQPSEQLRELRLALASGDRAEALARRRSTRAELALRRALAADPSPDLVPGRSAEAASLRAALALEAGTMRRALAEAEAALAEDEWSADAWAIKARALAELGDGPEAWLALRQLEWIDPGNREDIAQIRLLLGAR